MGVREIILIRHGQTKRNKMGEKILCGRADSPLTEEGVRQALALSQNPMLLDVQKVISSNLGRAYNTAKLIFPDMEIEQSEYAAERSLGDLEGLREEDVIKQYGYTKEALKIIRHSYGPHRAPNGENYSDARERFLILKNYVELNDCKKTAIVLHGVIMKIAITDSCGEDPNLAFNLHIPHCEPIVLEKRNESPLYTLKYPTWGRLTK